MNTGKAKGALRLLELRLQRPVQWVICALHFVELPVRCLFYHLDGKPDGPVAPGGPIGTAIKNLNENLLPYVDYQRISSNMLDVPRELFRGKQDLIVFHDLVRAVSNGPGALDPSYLTKKLPKISTVRWTTSFSRTLRVFMQTRNPSPSLIILVTYIQKESWSNLPIFHT